MNRPATLSASVPCRQRRRGARPQPAVANWSTKRREMSDRVLLSPSRRARPFFTRLRHRSRPVFLQGFNSKGGLWKTFLRQENVPRKSSRGQSSCYGRGARAGCTGRQGQRAGGRWAGDGGPHVEESAAQEGVRSREKRRRHAARGAGIERAHLAAVSPPSGSREEHVRTSPPPPSRRKSSRGSAAAPRQRSSTAEVARKSVATPRRRQRRKGRAVVPRRRRPTVRGSRRSTPRLADDSPPPEEKEKSGCASPLSPCRQRSRGRAAIPRRQRSQEGRVRASQLSPPLPEEQGESGRSSSP